MLVTVEKNQRPETLSLDSVKIKEVYGNRALLESPYRVLIVPESDDDKDDSTVRYVCDDIADILAQRGVTLLTRVGGEAYHAVAAAATRHAGGLVVFGSRPLSVYSQDPFSLQNRYRHPIPTSRVWTLTFEPEHSLFIRGLGFLRPARATATHIVRVGKSSSSCSWGIHDAPRVVDQILQ